ncbi:hypothetical protein DPX16_12889 [Anabarilius grahami]|uniref:Uncharacterized protein n=1 Tax=Anabarilius grahami TaxID=495550 RepID=A0A3N0XD65_ANAGA|nr:hypothetical protein DPX16_12889 [Anabarilius grahami]
MENILCFSVAAQALRISAYGFINKAQLDAGFADRLKLKDGEVTAVKDPGHESEPQVTGEVKNTDYLFITAPVSGRLGKSISKTAALVGCSRSAVVSIYQKWSKEGTVVNRRQSHGRPRLIDARGERRLAVWSDPKDELL